nr:hypothetical protein [Tanacetum cinerariifolium]
MPLKRDLRLIDKHIESVSMDVISNIAPNDVKTVKTIDVNHKGVFSTEEPKPIMKNNFSTLIIEDYHSDDETKVEISPTVEIDIKCFQKGHLQVIRHFNKYSAYKKTMFNNEVNVVKASGCWVWRPKEGRLKLKELIELCTKPSDRVLDLEKTKTSQAKEIADLKKRVKKLEKKQGQEL